MGQTAKQLQAIIFDKDETIFEYSEDWESVLIASIENAFTMMGHHD